MQTHTPVFAKSIVSIENSETERGACFEIKSEKGGMTSEYCSDNYIHLTTVGAEKLVSLINEFAESDGIQ